MFCSKKPSRSTTNDFYLSDVVSQTHQSHTGYRKTVPLNNCSSWLGDTPEKIWAKQGAIVLTGHTHIPQTHTGRSARRNGAERESSTIDFTSGAQHKGLPRMVGNAWDENKKSAASFLLTYFLSLCLFPVAITLHSACLCSNLGQMSWITACMLLKRCSLLLTSLSVLPFQIVGDWKAVAGIWEHRLCVNSNWVNSAVCNRIYE